LVNQKIEIRNLIKPNGGITLSQGDNSDTLSMQGGLKIIMYYKNDTCYTSEATMPLAYMNMVTQKMNHDSYKKAKENEWISPSGKIKVDITILKSSNQFITLTTQNKE